MNEHSGIYEVTFRHTFPLGDRIIKFEVYVGEDEYEFDLEDIKPVQFAIEYATHKFFKSYTLGKGSVLEVLNVVEL